MTACLRDLHRGNRADRFAKAGFDLQDFSEAAHLEDGVDVFREVAKRKGLPVRHQLLGDDQDDAKAVAADIIDLGQVDDNLRLAVGDMAAEMGFKRLCRRRIEPSRGTDDQDRSVILVIDGECHGSKPHSLRVVVVAKAWSVFQSSSDLFARAADTVKPRVPLRAQYLSND